MKKIICDGDKCENSFADLYPGECPIGWVRVECFNPGRRRVIGHMCPQCWTGPRAINFAKRMPWLLKGRQPNEEEIVRAWANSHA